MSRILGLLDILEGTRAPDLLPLQQLVVPLFVPDINNSPWLDSTSLSWVSHLEHSYAAIRGEMLGLLSTPNPNLEPYGPAYDSLDGTLTSEHVVPGWNAFYFYRAGRRIDRNCERCPLTASLLDQIPIGQEALFSILEPGAHIPEHSDGLNFFVTCHLGLVIPPGCEIRVATESRYWREGSCLVLNTSFLHEASNRSLNRRIVLLVDAWHPDLTSVEVAALSFLRPKLEELFKLSFKDTDL